MSPANKTNSEDYLRVYRQMVRIRVFEDNANQLYLSAKMPGLTHMYSGQEAVAVGICEALEVSDKITSTHRGHGHCVAKGAEFKEMFCELLGKAEGYCRGKGGSMHIADQANGNLGANAIVGGSAGIATGAALSAKRLGTKDVTVCFFGDGALGQGLLYEAMNMAALWKLPVIYACENNLYGEYTKLEEMAAGALTARAAAFGIETHVVDGQDVLAVNRLTRELVERARKGEGPFFLQLDTYRYYGHHVGDINREYYRSKEEETFWKTKRDPIANFGAWLVEEKIAAEDELKAIDKAVRADAEAAVAYAWPPRIRRRPRCACMSMPTMRPEETTMRQITLAKAVNEAIAEEMRRDPTIFVMGEDVAEAGTPFKVLSGLVEEFGRERIIDTPISEPGFMGIAVGAAMTGSRPIVDLMFGDFIFLVMDQLCNQAAKTHYMSGGKLKVPLVLRTNLGATRRSAAQHSQSLHALVAHIPGLKVALPSSAYEAKGLMKTAIRDDNPVVIFEDKMMYNDKAPVPEEEYLIPFGVANILRQGRDITLIATSSMVQVAQKAAETLAAEHGISAEIIDPRTIVPLDEETILTSVRKTGRAIVIDEGHQSFGVTAEIASRINEKAFYHLDAPVQRIGAMDVPVPFSPALEDLTVPTREVVVERARRSVRGELFDAA